MEALPLLTLFLFLAQKTMLNEAVIINNQTSATPVNYTHICTDLQRNTFFQPELVVGIPWKIFYTFNMKLQSSTTCLNMTFKLTTPEIIERFKADMHDYVEFQPTWLAATLHLTIGGEGNEVLLVSDQGPAGKFVGVPNMMRKSAVNLMPSRSAVPLLHYTMKLLRGGRYLLIMDCKFGAATLSGNANRPLDLEQVTPALEELKTSLGPGARVCEDQKTPEEMFPVVLK